MPHSTTARSGTRSLLTDTVVSSDATTSRDEGPSTPLGPRYVRRHGYGAAGQLRATGRRRRLLSSSDAREANERNGDQTQPRPPGAPACSSAASAAFSWELRLVADALARRARAGGRVRWSVDPPPLGRRSDTRGRPLNVRSDGRTLVVRGLGRRSWKRLSARFAAELASRPNQGSARVLENRAGACASPGVVDPPIGEPEVGARRRGSLRS
jgi:hypothetical protein